MDKKSRLNVIFKILEKLFDAGFNTEKEILKMQMSDIKKINGGLSSQELMIVLELQEAIKNKQLMTYISGKQTEKKEMKKDE